MALESININHYLREFFLIKKKVRQTEAWRTKLFAVSASVIRAGAIQGEANILLLADVANPRLSAIPLVDDGNRQRLLSCSFVLPTTEKDRPEKEDSQDKPRGIYKPKVRTHTYSSFSAEW